MRFEILALAIVAVSANVSDDATTCGRWKNKVYSDETGWTIHVSKDDVITYRNQAGN